MSEPAIDARPSKSPIARLVGVIVSPAETFEDVARHPGWLFPLACYALAFTIAFSVYAVKADWIAIVTDQIENFPMMGLLPDQARDEAVRGATELMRKQTQGQIAAENVLNVLGVGLLPWFHAMGVVYATMFYLMGSFPKLRLGAAWGWMLLCCLFFVAFGGVGFLARAVFADAPQSRLVLLGAAAIVIGGAWTWILDGRARKDPAFHQVLSVCTYSSAVAILACVAILAVALGTGEAIATPLDRFVKSNLGALLQPDAPVAKTLLRSLDLFTIWTLVVLTIGFKAATKLSAGVTASITFLPWVVWVLVKVAMAAAFPGT